MKTLRFHTYIHISCIEICHCQFFFFFFNALKLCESRQRKLDDDTVWDQSGFSLVRFLEAKAVTRDPECVQ